MTVIAMTREIGKKLCGLGYEVRLKNRLAELLSGRLRGCL
jgi:hypothetical protein